MKFKVGLLGKIVIAMVVGVVIGEWGPAWTIRSLNTFGGIFGQLVKFLVPFIILGLVTPAIAETGKSAGRLLLTTVALAVASTLFAGWYSFFMSKAVFSLTLAPVALDAAQATAKSFPAFFKIPIPPPLDVVTSLVASFMLGLGIVAAKGERLLGVFTELRDVVTLTIAKAFVPLLPPYVATVIADMMACGKLSALAGPAVKIMASCMAFSAGLLLVQYAVAGVIARKNPIRALWNMLPAYLTGWGCCSSAATIPVTLRQTLKNGVSRDIADLVVPLCANVHLAGSMCNMVAYAAAILFLFGEPMSYGAFAQYIFMIAIVAVASPGVPGGVVLASASIVEAALGFSPERYALMVAMYMALDGMGTACNLTGDGAIALVVDRFRGPSGERS